MSALDERKSRGARFGSSGDTATRPVTARTGTRTWSAEIAHQISIAWYFAWSDTRARYKRSVLGPFWLVLSTMIGIGGLALVWAALMKVDAADFVPSLTIGLVLWNMISGSVTGAAGVFARHATEIKNIKTPSLRISLQLLFQQMVNFVHNLVLVAVVLAIYPQNLSPLALLAIPGLALVLVNLLWVIQLLGFLGARYRDFDPLIGALMPILFFMSPVLYRSHQLGARSFLMSFNPMGYWVEVVREPILGTVPSVFTYSMAVAMAVVGWWLAMWITRAKGHRLAYWV